MTTPPASPSHAPWDRTFAMRTTERARDSATAGTSHKLLCPLTRSQSLSIASAITYVRKKLWRWRIVTHGVTKCITYGDMYSYSYSIWYFRELTPEAGQVMMRGLRSNQWHATDFVRRCHVLWQIGCLVLSSSVTVFLSPARWQRFLSMPGILITIKYYEVGLRFSL